MHMGADSQNFRAAKIVIYSIPFLELWPMAKFHAQMWQF